MKRLALLLAAVGLGSGCVIETCDPSSLSIDWSFIDVDGFTGRTCAQVGVDNVDVYVDGVLEASAVPCTAYGIVIDDYPSGSREIMVEGFAGATIINRDWFTGSVSSCGDSFFLAQPGEGELEILPTTCSSPGNYLTYELWDVTRSSPYILSAIYPNSLALGDYTCASGIFFNVPYGNYDLAGIEEVNSIGTVVYNSKCTVTFADVVTSGLTSVPVAWTDTAACF